MGGLTNTWWYAHIYIFIHNQTYMYSYQYISKTIMCVYIFQPTCLLTMSSCIFGFALWASMLLLACRIHMSVDDWYGYLLVDGFHCKLSISKLLVHILMFDVWYAHLGFDGCSTQQSIMLHEYPCFLVKTHQMPHIWTICDWSYYLLWRRNVAKVSCNSYSTIIAKKQWKSTPPVLICGFISNGISTWLQQWLLAIQKLKSPNGTMCYKL